MKNPSLSDILRLTDRLLTEHDVPHALIGGLAVGLRGYPRSTVDIDYLIRVEDSGAVRKALESAGFHCEAQTAETLHFGGLGAVDFLLAQRPVSRAMLTAADPVRDLDIPVLQVEDIIGLKIQAYHNDPSREWKDLADIAELIRANPELDWERVRSHAALFQAEEKLEEIRARVRP